MHSLLTRLADALQGCTEDLAKADELGIIADAIEACAAKRWPEGKEHGGKG
jgi:hypothetical protein